MAFVAAHSLAYEIILGHIRSQCPRGNVRRIWLYAFILTRFIVEPIFLGYAEPFHEPVRDVRIFLRIVGLSGQEINLCWTNTIVRRSVAFNYTRSLMRVALVRAGGIVILTDGARVHVGIGTGCVSGRAPHRAAKDNRLSSGEFREDSEQVALADSTIPFFKGIVIGEARISLKHWPIIELGNSASLVIINTFGQIILTTRLSIIIPKKPKEFIPTYGPA